jgi:hypothetical protein
MQTNLDDDEEDFLALVGSKRGSVNVNDTDSVATARINSSFSQIPAVVDHVELSPRATNQASPAQQSHSELPSFEDFKDALQEFYATYNFGNLEKVPYLAERFIFRRWDLWRQLSIKYRLSPRESANLWIRFNVKFDGIPECARRLFDSPETVQISSDSLEERRKIWIKLLAISSDSQREQYDKHVLEVSKSGQVDDQANNCIRIDVVRTHQELSFFQEVRPYFSLPTTLFLGRESERNG